MWQRLVAHHQNAPLQLPLHGGDQIYDDDVVQCHPDLLRWKRCSPGEQPRIAFISEMAGQAGAHLLARYTRLYAGAPMAWLLARAGSHPVPGHPVRLHLVPGKRAICTAQRNLLLLRTEEAGWFARRDLEDDGPCPWLAL
jgi:hypothetical protein